jgi:hypothetical protein
MRYIIIAVQKSLFVIDKPLATFIVVAEDMYWGMKNFERKYPEWEFLEIN